MPIPKPRVLPIVLGVILVATAAVLAHRGWSFYRLSLEDRVIHADYRKLRPSGTIGNGYGFVATALVLLNLAYLLRRRIAGSRLGSMRIWLDLHVFTGLLAAVLVSFHSAFQLRTPIAKTSAASLAVVVLTGVIGRFLYALTPAADGVRLRAALDGLEAAAPGSRAPAASILDALPAPRVRADASLLRSLWEIPRWRRVSGQRQSALRVIAPSTTAPGPIRAAWRELTRAVAIDTRASGMAALLRSWRSLHRFFALLMLVAVGVHAGIAWHYGYRWIFE